MGIGVRVKVAAGIYLFGLAIHLLDHLRRGASAVTPEVLWAGAVASVVGLGIAAALYLGLRQALLPAFVFGAVNALGVAAVHIAPAWSAFSDPFLSEHATPLSWFAVLTEIAGSLAMAAAAGVELSTASRRRVA